MQQNKLFSIHKIPAPGFIKDIYANAKEIYVFAFLPLIADKPIEYKIGMSGLGEDYHRVLKHKIEEFATCNLELEKSYYEIAVDSQVFDEKKLSVMANAGFVSRNNLVYSPYLKGFPFLGELITFKETPYYNTELQSCSNNICQNCCICVEICPAKALSSDFSESCSNETTLPEILKETFMSREPKRTYKKEKCISFLTQKSGVLSTEEMKLIGDNIYGCDLCQNVCPMNGIALKREISEVDSFPSLYNLATLSKETFEEIRNFPFAWIGRVKLKRNAIICAYNKRIPELFDILEEAKKDPSPIINETAEGIFDLCSKKH